MKKGLNPKKVEHRFKKGDFIVYQFKDWHGIQFYAGTVDHYLRPDSDFAHWVGLRLCDNGVWVAIPQHIPVLLETISLGNSSPLFPCTMVLNSEPDSGDRPNPPRMKTKTEVASDRRFKAGDYVAYRFKTSRGIHFYHGTVLGYCEGKLADWVTLELNGNDYCVSVPDHIPVLVPMVWSDTLKPVTDTP